MCEENKKKEVNIFLNNIYRFVEKEIAKESKDVRMFITILIASINYIVLATRQYRIFNGIDFSNPEAWELCKQTIYKYIRALFENILK